MTAFSEWPVVDEREEFTVFRAPDGAEYVADERRSCADVAVGIREVKTIGKLVAGAHPRRGEVLEVDGDLVTLVRRTTVRERRGYERLVSKWWFPGSRRKQRMFTVDRHEGYLPQEMVDAVASGAGIAIYDGTTDRARGELSLSMLAPLVEDLQSLCIYSQDTLTDVDVLSRANALRHLILSPDVRVASPIPFTELPALISYEGPITRTTRTVLQHPGVRYLAVEGLLPKTFQPIESPVKEFEQTGGNAQTSPPRFAHPELVDSYARHRVRSFDFAEMSQFPRLKRLSVAHARLVNVAAADSRRLRQLRLRWCTTAESWDALPAEKVAEFWGPHPAPRPELLERMQQAGTDLFDLPDGREIWDTIDVHEPLEEGERWTIQWSELRALEQITPALQESGASGYDGEKFLHGIIRELRTEGHHIDFEADSESSMTALYFPDGPQAALVATRAKEHLRNHATA